MGKPFNPKKKTWGAPGGVPTSRRAFYVGSVGCRQTNSNRRSVKKEFEFVYTWILQEWFNCLCRSWFRKSWVGPVFIFQSKKADRQSAFLHYSSAGSALLFREFLILEVAFLEEDIGAGLEFFRALGKDVLEGGIAAFAFEEFMRGQGGFPAVQGEWMLVL